MKVHFSNQNLFKTIKYLPIKDNYPVQTGIDRNKGKKHCGQRIKKRTLVDYPCTFVVLEIKTEKPSKY